MLSLFSYFVLRFGLRFAAWLLVEPPLLRFPPPPLLPAVLLLLMILRFCMVFYHSAASGVGVSCGLINPHSASRSNDPWQSVRM